MILITLSEFINIRRGHQSILGGISWFGKFRPSTALLFLWNILRHSSQNAYSKFTWFRLVRPRSYSCWIVWLKALFTVRGMSILKLLQDASLGITLHVDAMNKI